MTQPTALTESKRASKEIILNISKRTWKGASRIFKFLKAQQGDPLSFIFSNVLLMALQLTQVVRVNVVVSWCFVDELDACK